MSKHSQAKVELSSPMTSDMKTEVSELWKNFQNSKPVFTSTAEARNSVRAQLEKLASSHGLSVDDLVAQAHSTNDFQSHRIEAMHLERQLGYLK